MLIMNHLTEGNLTERIRVKDLNEEQVVCMAKQKYEEASKLGQILGDYEAPVWKMITEGRSVKKVCFNKYETEIRGHLSDAEYDRFVSNLKTMVMLRYGSCNHEAMQAMTHYICEEMAASGFREGVKDAKPKNHGVLLSYLLEFLQVTEWGTKKYYKECEKILVSTNAKNADDREDRNHPCVMNEFRSYLEFSHLINHVWKHVMTEQQKKFYFPLKLFWDLTCILPQRVTEFCVLPYDCIQMQDGHYYITIRRCRIKGSTSRDVKIHYYSIDKDTYKETYEITKHMYDMIDQWRMDTADFYHPYDLLFSVEYTGSLGYKWMFSRSKNSIFDDKRLGNMLKQFYAEFIIDYYGRVIVNDDDLLQRYYDKRDGSYQMFPGEMMYMQLKHTRHLAMINLKRWGCNPMIIKRFAGHTSAAEDANYYNNVCRFARCATKLLWERIRNPEDACVEDELLVEKSNMTPFIDRDAPHVRVDGGRCYNKGVLCKNYSECMKYNGKCKSCGCHIPDNAAAVTEQEEKRINEEAAFVIKMLKSKTCEAHIEECQQRILKLQTDLNDYATKLWRELMEQKLPDYVYNE